jgi:hypothetical protein
MPPSDKARKILWGSSGNRCAMRRRDPVIDATSEVAQAIVGENCHIISGKKQRAALRQKLMSPKRIAEGENLILLCGVHHKMVDDQSKTSTSEILRKLKANHEAWVRASLAEERTMPPLRLRRVKEKCLRIFCVSPAAAMF